VLPLPTSPRHTPPPAISSQFESAHINKHTRTCAQTYTHTRTHIYTQIYNIHTPKQAEEVITALGLGGHPDPELPPLGELGFP